ncbi:MAG: RagB/SusD family nutrient uptake outer membrane protein [Bacteroidales bacterium]|nr:RagB/SusD family nutrient uptake outer membrane protein [Bacteroidales bacterium]
MKKIKIFAIGLAALAMCACSEDLLKLDNPNSLTTETAFSTESDINASLTGIYHSFLSSYYAMMNTLQFSGQSDEATSHSVAWVTQYVLQEYSDMNCRWNFTSYNQLYEQVARCNQVITYAENVTEWNTYDKNQILAQAKAIRAYDYYQLAMMYQIAPYVDYVAAAGDQPQAGVFEETCQKIINDAKFAYETLPASYKTSDGYKGPYADLYMVTKWFAACVLAKTYMNWGDYLKGGYKYAEALPYYKAVVEQGGFSLLADYNDNFKHDTENNAESIWEIQFAECASTFGNYWGITNNGANVSTTSWRWKFLGAAPIGWTDQSAEPWVVYAFKNEKTVAPVNGSNWDPRLPASVLYADIFKDYPNHVQWGEWNAETGFSNPDWNVNWAYCNKYVDQYTSATAINNANSDGTNLRVFRLGAILLEYAECLAQTGDLAGAVKVVDQVRARAGLCPLGERQNYKVEDVWTNSETNGTTDFNAEYGYAAFENNAAGNLADFMKVLDLEKLKETAYELDRFTDIRRWGISRDNEFLAKVKKRSYKYNANFTPVRAWIPLPTDDVKNNPNLEQLTGW